MYFVSDPQNRHNKTEDESSVTDSSHEMQTVCEMLSMISTYSVILERRTPVTWPR